VGLRSLSDQIERRAKCLPIVCVPSPVLHVSSEVSSPVIYDPDTFALGSPAAELSHAVVGGSVVELVAVSVTAEVFGFDSGAAEPDVVFAAVVSVAGVAEPQACVDTPAPFDV